MRRPHRSRQRVACRARSPLARAVPELVWHGGRYGLAALTTGEWLPASSMDDAWLSSAEASAGMALGGGRDRLTDQDLDRGVTLLDSREIDTVFLIGGNGTMSAGRAMAARAAQAGVPLRVAGVPKTIDNVPPDLQVDATAVRDLLG
jgi:6-phosphofructokinase